MEDALAFGGAAIALLNHADRVKVACLAQLVNAIAPIMTETGGPAWRQTIFHPFAHLSRFGRGTVLRTQVQCDSYAATYYDPRGPADLWFPLPAVPYLKVAAVADAATGALTLFALNRHLHEPMAVDVELPGHGAVRVLEALQLCDPDLHACNTRDEPERVAPSTLRDVDGGIDGVRCTLQPASWNVIRMGRAQQ
jgi:alpha-L-arabinofuranosidase